MNIFPKFRGESPHEKKLWDLISMTKHDTQARNQNQIINSYMFHCRFMLTRSRATHSAAQGKILVFILSGVHSAVIL